METHKSIRYGLVCPLPEKTIKFATGVIKNYRIPLITNTMLFIRLFKNHKIIASEYQGNNG